MLGMEESDHEDFEPSPVQPASAETSRTPSTTARNVVADDPDGRQRPGGATIVSARTGMNRVLLTSEGAAVRRVQPTYASRGFGATAQVLPSRTIRVRADAEGDAGAIHDPVDSADQPLYQQRTLGSATLVESGTVGRRQYVTNRVVTTPGGTYARVNSPTSYVTYDAVTGQQVVRRTQIIGSGYVPQRTGAVSQFARRLPPTQRWTTLGSNRMPLARRQQRVLRPMYFDQDAEAEDRAIAEAIAREEELMRQEEERELEISRTFDADFQRIEEEILRKEAATRQELEAKRLSAYHGYRPLIQTPVSRLDQLTNAKVQQMMEAPTNLATGPNDTEDDRAIKMALDGMITQVSKWDRQYGWHKNILRKLREKRGLSTEPTIHSLGQNSSSYTSFAPRSQPVRQVEPVLQEAMERLRREINKRRLRLEFEAEDQLGIPSPWRKGKSRPPRPPTRPTEPQRPQAPVDPSTISLFDDVADGNYENREGERPSKTDDVTSKKRPSISDKSDKKRKRSHKSSHGSERDESERRLKRKSESVDATSMNLMKSEPGFQLEIDVNGRHCYCNKPYNPKKFYVACDRCYKWFHGKCIGITEKKAQKMDSWVCQECEKERSQPKEELYCVCRRPYDQAKFYVGCDTCEGWFHPECVGTTQRDIEQCKQYFCPECRKSQQQQRPTSSQIAGGYESSSSATSIGAMDKADYDILWRLYNSLMDHRNSAPFRQPVSPQKYSTYQDVIKTPMDLSVMRRKLEGREYLHLKDFVSDVCLIFENARLVNSKTTHIWHCADVLEKRFREDLIAVKEEVDRRRVSECPTTASLDIDSDTLLGFGSDINLDPNMLQEFL